MSGETAALIANKLAELDPSSDEKLTKLDPRVKAAAKHLLPQSTSSGEHGRQLMEGSYESESAFHLYSPEHVPKPIAFGSYDDDNDPATWFYLCEFRDMSDEQVPDPADFVPVIVGIHKASMV